MSMTENAVNSRNPAENSSNRDPATAALLASMDISLAGAATREELQAVSDEAKPRPKANLAAQTLDEVYSVETLIGKETMQLLMVKEWLDAVASSESITTKSRYVSQRVHRIAASGDVKTLKILRYLLLLLDFKSAFKSGGKGGGLQRLPKDDDLRKATGVQSFLVEEVKKRFTDGP